MVSADISKNASLVKKALENKGLTCEILAFPSSTRTAQDAATAIGCEVAQIAKSLIFKTISTHRPVLVLASGSNRVNEKTIEKYVDEKITKADADFSRDVTGFAIGGIPPVGHLQKIELIFIDEDLLAFDNVWAAAGTPHTVFNIKLKDLIELSGGTLISIR